jgi:hypothetical protein
MLALIAALLSIAVTPAQAAGAPACKPRELRLSLDGRDGDFNGMSHGGTALVIRNLGPDCSLPALLPVEFHDARGSKLPVVARNAAGAQRGQLRLGAGHRAEMTLRWVSGPVYPKSRSGHVAEVRIQIGGRRCARRLPPISTVKRASLSRSNAVHGARWKPWRPIARAIFTRPSVCHGPKTLCYKRFVCE